MISPALLETLARFTTCVLADAVDKLGLQLNNQGYTQPGLRQLSGAAATIVGYAATARVRSSNPPITGHFYFRHTEWWAGIERLAGPRIIVLQDVDDSPGSGACVGQIAASAFRALHCAGAVTNGAGREIPALTAMNFSLFAPHISPSRAYSHLVSHSCPVEILGLAIHPGDLLAADLHGVVSLPHEHAEEIAATADILMQRKQTFVDFCASSRFSIEGMEERLRQLPS